MKDTHKISIRLETCQQLLHHKNHFSSHGIDKDAAKFILRNIGECGLRKMLLLVVYLNTMPVDTKQMESKIDKQMQAFFHEKALLEKTLLQRTLKRTIASSLIGLFTFLLCFSLELLCKYFINYFSISVRYTFLIEALEIIAWVVLWPPLYLLFFEWWPIAYNWLILRNVSTNTTVKLVPFGDMFQQELKSIKEIARSSDELLLLEKQTSKNTITLHVDSMKQLFNTNYSDPFYTSAIKKDVANYVFDEFWRLGQTRGSLYLDLTVHRGPGYAPSVYDSLTERGVQVAIHEYYQRKKDIVDYKTKRKLKHALLCLVIGLVVYLLSVMASYYAALIGQKIDSPFFYGISDLISIGSWAVLWYPVEILWFCWWEPMRDRQRYSVLCRLKVNLRFVGYESTSNEEHSIQ